MDELHLDFTEANGVPVDAQPLRVAVEGQPRPTFAYTYQLIGDGGNGDGLVQAGESHRLHVTVRNMGAGRSRRATATQAKIEGRKVLYRSNRGGHSQSRLDFSGDIPIWPGNNMVTVVARENNEVRSMQTLFVYRTDGQRHAHQDGEAAKAR